MIFKKLIILLLIPIFAFISGVWLINQNCDQSYKKQYLSHNTLITNTRPLNERVLGYSTSDITQYWTALDQRSLNAEQCFLEEDLFFPIFYGAALLYSLVMVWHMLGNRYFNLVLFAPVVITIIADWTENLIHIQELKNFALQGVGEIHPKWIQVASWATTSKLLFFLVSMILLWGLAAAVLFKKSSKK